MKIAVIGDLILDIERVGTSHRTSPEDPNCLVLSDVKRKTSLGGAANVALWLASVPEFSVSLLGHYTYDESGRELIDLCKQSRIQLSPHLCRFDGGYQTTTKERICLLEDSRLRHLARCDREAPFPLTSLDYANIIRIIEANRFDLIVCIDYDKGMFVGPHAFALQEFLSCCAGAIVVVNSKYPERWAGCSAEALICNQKESLKLWDIQSNNEGYPDVEAESVVITQSEKGVCAYTREDMFSYPTFADNVVDVTGAGDAFTAGFSAQYLQERDNNDPLQRMKNCLEQGQLWAACCCTQVGCGKPKYLRGAVIKQSKGDCYAAMVTA